MVWPSEPRSGWRPADHNSAGPFPGDRGSLHRRAERASRAAVAHGNGSAGLRIAIKAAGSELGSIDFPRDVGVRLRTDGLHFDAGRDALNERAVVLDRDVQGDPGPAAQRRRSSHLPCSECALPDSGEGNPVATDSDRSRHVHRPCDLKCRRVAAALGGAAGERQGDGQQGREGKRSQPWAAALRGSMLRYAAKHPKPSAENVAPTAANAATRITPNDTRVAITTPNRRRGAGPFQDRSVPLSHCSDQYMVTYAGRSANT